MSDKLHICVLQSSDMIVRDVILLPSSLFVCLPLFYKYSVISFILGLHAFYSTSQISLALF